MPLSAYGRVLGLVTGHVFSVPSCQTLASVNKHVCAHVLP